MKQKMVIKVEVHCDKCRTKALKIAAATDGVDSVALEGSEKDMVVVIGDGVDAVGLTSCLRKKVNYASLESVEEVKPKKEEEKEEKKEGKKPKPSSPCCDPRPPRCELDELVYDPNPPSTCSIM